MKYASNDRCRSREVSVVLLGGLGGVKRSRGTHLGLAYKVEEL